MPWFGEQDLGGKVISMHGLPMFHIMGPYFVASAVRIITYVSSDEWLINSSFIPAIVWCFRGATQAFRTF
jgi:hypothetical protein